MLLLRAALSELIPHKQQSRERGALLVTCLAAAGLLALGLQGSPSAASITVAVPSARGSIVTAFSQPAVPDLASADAARLFNAALPVDLAQVQPARPFVLAGTPDERGRALLCLTQAIYYEAGFEPVEGRRAVAQVVLNRVRHPAFPNSVCGVVYQGAGTAVCQFTFICEGKLARRPLASAWREAEDIARAALLGYVEASVGESTHYHADYVAPQWAPLLSKVAVIGQHIFYRWQGPAGEKSAFTARYVGEGTDPIATAVPGINTPVQVAAAGTSEASAARPRVAYDIDALLTKPASADDTTS